MELWKEIPKSNGYSVSNFGNIKKNNLYINIKQGRCSIGGGIGRQFVHRLVANAFVENDDPINKKYVVHIDGNNQNNNAENLRWVTRNEIPRKPYSIKKYKYNEILDIYNKEYLPNPHISMNYLDKKYNKGKGYFSYYFRKFGLKVKECSINHARSAREHTGETVVNKDGHKLTLIEWFDKEHITIRYDDGTILKDRKYLYFKKGLINKDEDKGYHLTKEMFELKKVKTAYINGAKARGYSWELDDDKFYSMIHKPCFYCGAVDVNHLYVPSGYGKGRSIKYNGIDRIDNNLGYIEGNVVPCCPICNRAKRDMEYNEWYDYINRLISHNAS